MLETDKRSLQILGGLETETVNVSNTEVYL